MRSPRLVASPPGLGAGHVLRASVFALAVWLSAGCAELITDIGPDRATDTPCQAHPRPETTNPVHRPLARTTTGTMTSRAGRRFGSRGNRDWKQVSAGDDFACGVTTDGVGTAGAPAADRHSGPGRHTRQKDAGLLRRLSGQISSSDPAPIVFVDDVRIGRYEDLSESVQLWLGSDLRTDGLNDRVAK